MREKTKEVIITLAFILLAILSVVLLEKYFNQEKEIKRIMLFGGHTFILSTDYRICGNLPPIISEFYSPGDMFECGWPSKNNVYTFFGTTKIIEEKKVVIGQLYFISKEYYCKVNQDRYNLFMEGEEIKCRWVKQ